MALQGESHLYVKPGVHNRAAGKHGHRLDDALAVAGALPNLGKSLIAADPMYGALCFDAFRLRVEIDRNGGQVRLKALVSSAFGEAKDLSDLGDAGDPALSDETIPLRGFEPRFPD